MFTLVMAHATNIWLPALHTAYTQHLSCDYCAMRLSLIIMFVFHSIFIYYRRACRGTCVQRLHWRSGRRRSRRSSRRMCNQVIYDQPRGEHGCCCCCFVDSPDSRAKMKKKIKKNPRQYGRPVWNCKLVSLNINALSNRIDLNLGAHTLIAQLQGMTWHPGLTPNSPD